MDKTMKTGNVLEMCNGGADDLAPDDSLDRFTNAWSN